MVFVMMERKREIGHPSWSTLGLYDYQTRVTLDSVVGNQNLNLVDKC